MGQLTQNYDWSPTSVGPPEQWSTSLRVQISMMLRSRFPMLIFWGHDLVTFYNDAFRPSLGDDGKHPSSLGQPGKQSWAESWPTIGPMIYDIMAGGEAVWFEDQKLPLYRDGQLGYAYWTYSFSPITNDTGAINGILVTCSETTKAVESLQQLSDTNTELKHSLALNYRLQQEQQAAHRQLQASESFARNLLYGSPVASLVFTGQEMVIQSINAGMLTMLGRDATIIGQPVMVAMPELRGTPLMDRLQQVLATGETFEQPEERIDLVRYGHAYTGYYHYIHTALTDASGRFSGVVVTAIEITAQVLARQQVEQSEAALRNAIELAELGTWRMDIGTGQMTYSERLQNWLGVTNAVLDREASPRVHPKDRERVSRAMEKALEKGGSGRYEETYTITNAITGQERIIHASGQTVFDAAGTPLSLAGTAQNVTLQQQQQLALEQQVQQRTEELAAVNSSLTASNEKLLTRNREYITINDKLGEVNSDLRRSNQNLEQFAYVASHDLQEPLRKIQQFGDLLTNQYGTQLGEGVNYLQRMQSAASRMSTLVRDLLTYSRIATQREANEPISLADVVNTALSDLELRIEETKAAVHVKPLPTVLGDASQLAQLFYNLLTNALKFARRDESGGLIPPRVTIKATLVRAQDLPDSVKPNRMVEVYHRIDVVDNGIGFEEKYLDRIFQVFQRLHSKNEFAGTGIGLAICGKVVANHGGAITASSQPGQGATFCVYLPA